jgi:S-DNA-T family DNA segregation ATPase FtsK/SpoIIIE
VTPDEILEVSDDLVAEMHDRLALVPRGRDVIAISEELPRITVFVDEGGELIAASKEKGYGRIIENLRTLARMGRAAEIIVIWATQKPTMSGDGHGIDSQVAAQITVRASLYLSTASESMNVFGSDALEKGWHAHELPEMGHALLRMGAKGSNHPIRTRAFSPADVIALPDRPVWRRKSASAIPAQPTLRLVKDQDYVIAPPAQEAPAAVVPAEAAPPTNREKVAAAIGAGARTVADVALVTGINKGTVSKAVKSLLEAGEVKRDADGVLSVVTTDAGEVSA